MTSEDLSKRHLPIALSAAVPLYIMELQQIPMPERWHIIQEWCADTEEVLVRTGEAILYRTKPGESAEAFNAVAKAIAALSFCPGGISLFGQHWESK